MVTSEQICTEHKCDKCGEKLSIVRTKVSTIIFIAVIAVMWIFIYFVNKAQEKAWLESACKYDQLEGIDSQMLRKAYKTEYFDCKNFKQN